MKLLSYERYRASARERRLYSGKITTKYQVLEGAKLCYVFGYGPTQHDRKRNAEEKAKILFENGEYTNHVLPYNACS